MTDKWEGGYSTVFGALLDTEIAEALKNGMTLEDVYFELAARARELADCIFKNATERAMSEAAECEA